MEKLASKRHFCLKNICKNFPHKAVTKKFPKIGMLQQNFYIFYHTVYNLTFGVRIYFQIEFYDTYNCILFRIFCTLIYSRINWPQLHNNKPENSAKQVAPVDNLYVFGICRGQTSECVSKFHVPNNTFRLTFGRLFAHHPRPVDSESVERFMLSHNWGHRRPLLIHTFISRAPTLHFT